jgi:hypothetical protein
MKVLVNELDVYFIPTIAVDLFMVVVGVTWDMIAQHFAWQHNTTGLPLAQVAWCLFFGIKAVWGYLYWIHYGK